MVKAAINFMTKHKEDPFLMVYSDPMPHAPYFPSEQFKGEHQNAVNMAKSFTKSIGSLSI